MSDQSMLRGSSPLKLSSEDFQIKDSGSKEDYGTGAARDAKAEKGFWSLLPYRPLERVAVHYKNGGAKYGFNNWRLGVPLPSFLDSAMRHLAALADHQDDEDHAAAVAWNMLCYMETQELIARGELSDSLLTLKGDTRAKDAVAVLMRLQERLGITGSGEQKG